jgi:hypothetical protein
LDFDSRLWLSCKRGDERFFVDDPVRNSSLQVDNCITLDSADAPID